MQKANIRRICEAWDVARSVNDRDLINLPLMSQQSSIEWTDSTWNPVRGCTKVSPGCKHCYAETFAERFRGVRGHPYERGFDLRIVPERLTEPLRWKDPRMIFVNSMSDLFHEGVSEEYIVRVAEVMCLASWHIFQVLTKRSTRMMNMLNGVLKPYTSSTHIWWGVSIENRKYGLPRLRHLQSADVPVRFLSVEPLLEDIGEIDLSKISWVIVGGESGPYARKLEADWVRSIRNQCKSGGVPFFFKQWGGINKAKSGRILDGRLYDAFPCVQRGRVPSTAIRVGHINKVMSSSSLVSIS
jgi:protein gp37